ncbi:MAG: hypothetical protein ABEK04_00360 [Candidatus Nanohalobium sp.]
MTDFKASAMLVFTAALLILSSGCVADSIEEDSIPGKVLDMFGNFSSSNNSTSYEFSLESITDNTLMGPVQKVVDRFRKNMSSREGVQMKNMNVKVLEVSSDKARVLVDYRAKSNETGVIDRNVTFTFVKRNGQWQLKAPFKENMDGSYYNNAYN